MAGEFEDDDGLALSRRQLLKASVATVGAIGMVGASSGASAVEVVSANVQGAAAGRIAAARYLLRRLKQLGCATLFGVPGKTCEAMFANAAAEAMQLVVHSSDLEAGYAADAYARMRGIGAVSVTHGVGMLSLVNAVAGAYAEKSPLVVINGGPSNAELDFQNANDIRFTHSIGRIGAADAAVDARRREAASDLAMFRPVTVFAERITSADRLADRVDTALKAAISQQRPVYLEIARNVMEAAVDAPTRPLRATFPASGNEAAIAGEILDRLAAARKPLALVGIEVARFGLEDETAALLDRLGVAWATTLLSKSVLAETTAGFVGTYEGLEAPARVRNAVRDADLIIGLGTILGVWHRHLVTDAGGELSNRVIRIANGNARFGGRAPRKVDLGGLIAALNVGRYQPAAVRRDSHNAFRRASVPADLAFDGRRGLRRLSSANGEGVTYDEVAGIVSDQLDSGFVTLCDTSLAMYSAADINVAGRNAFLCNSVWQSIGYSVGAAVGVGVAERENGGRRPLVICGDGGFQMMAQGLSTLARQRIAAIVLVLDNGTYGIEQHLINGAAFTNPAQPFLPFVTLQRWKYADLAKAMGFTSAAEVVTPTALSAELRRAKAAAVPTLISVRVPQRSRPSELG